MTGLQRVLKSCGSMILKDADGNKTVWVWDYANDKARRKDEMTKKETVASEKMRRQQIKNTIQKYEGQGQ